jgi:hypothetical protein
VVGLSYVCQHLSCTGFSNGNPVPQPMSPAKCGKLTINGVQRKTGVRLHPAGQCPARIYALILRSRNQESGYFGLARYRHLARTDLDIGKCWAVTRDLSRKPRASHLRFARDTHKRQPGRTLISPAQPTQAQPVAQSFQCREKPIMDSWPST